MALKPYVDGDKIKKIEVEGSIIPARNNGVPVSELTEIISAFNTLLRYFDFQSIGKVEDEAKEWSQEEIFDFLNERNERQLLFFRILTEYEEIGREELVDKMAKRLKKPKFNGRMLAGALGGIGIRTNKLNKEPLYEKDWKEDEDGWECYYKLSTSYSPIIEDWFEEEKEE